MLKKLLLILLIIVGVASATLWWINRPSSRIPADGITFEVQPGWSGYRIAMSLQEQGIIRSAFSFRLLGRILPMSLKAGSYHIPAQYNTYQIFQLLASGKTQLFSITIPEGLTLSQVAQLFVDQGFITDAQQLIQAATDRTLLDSLHIQSDSAQGFLFPDTYMMAKPYAADQIISAMVNNFFVHLARIDPNYTQLSWDELYNKIKLASVVEKEYRVAAEAPKIASVFYNRLEQNIKLESCATVIYVITEELGKPHPNRIFFKDLEVVSPYNLYLNNGLPPHPISNAGQIALDAVWHPANTDSLYFVVADSAAGTHYFSNNIDDHNNAREQYINTFTSK
jgi:UPF0755 protein